MTKYLVSLKPILVTAETPEKAKGEALRLLYHGFEPKLDEVKAVE